MPVDPVGARVLAVARPQHGIVTSAQLQRAGLGRHAIAHRVAQGWLLRLHRGVYLVGPLEAPLSLAMAAVLACGEGALLGHHPGAVVLGFRPPPAGPPHVVVPTDVRSRPGLRVHRVSNLHPADATRVQGIPVTSPARTLLDLAAELPQRETDRATDEARVRHLVTEHSLNEQFSRYPRHPGIAALKRAQRTDPKLTRSEAERRLLELIRAARLPEPETNIRLHGHEVDFLWRECGLVVEVDGYAFHSGRGSFERDRRRDAQLATAGYTVIRFTWRQITDEPAVVVATLAATLAAQRPPLRLRSSTVSA